MNLKQKIPLAFLAIQSITRHHDATEVEVKAAAGELQAHITKELAEMSGRRKAYTAMRAAEAKAKGAKTA
jgi:hypothetical protein